MSGVRALTATVEQRHSSVPELPGNLDLAASPTVRGVPDEQGGARVVSARHAAAPRRRFPVLVAGATLLGLWFGIVAPEVSPVAPPVPAGQVQPVDDPGPVGQQPDGRR